MSEQRQQARRHWAPWGSPTPQSPPPLSEQSLPSHQPDPVTWRAAWGIVYPLLGFQGPVEAHRAGVCVQSKVTFVNAIGSCRD